MRPTVTYVTQRPTDLNVSSSYTAYTNFHFHIAAREATMPMCKRKLRMSWSMKTGTRPWHSQKKKKKGG